MKAKFLSVLLALTMVLSLLPTAVLAADDEPDAQSATVTVATADALQNALNSANDGDTITVSGTIEVDAPLVVKNTVTLAGGSIVASENFTSNSNQLADFNLISLKTADKTLTLKDITLDAKGKTLVVYCNAGKVVVDGATITGGKTNTYVAGVYMTSASQFEMNSGSITGNEVGDSYKDDHYTQYASDLWIGANANGALAAINGGTIGNIFVNSNDWSANNPGGFTMNAGSVENIYVEYSDGYGASFTYNGGTINHLYLSKTEGNGSSIEVTPVAGTSYTGGVPENPVARISGSYYATVAEAVAAADADDTVTLLADTTENVVIPADKDITLDLNGKTLTNAGGDTITNHGKLTVVGAGTVDNITHAKAALINDGTAVLSGGTFTRSKEAGENSDNSGGNSYYTILNDKGGDLTINAGVKVVNSGHFSSMIRNGGTTDTTSTLLINGGSFSGGINTIKNDEGGTLTIKGGDFSNVTQHVIMNWNIANIYDGTFEANSIATAVLFSSSWNGVGGTLNFYGGKVKTTGDSQEAICDHYDANNKGTVTVSGGYFTVDPTDYVADGFRTAASDEDGYTYMVVKGTNDDTTIIVADKVAADVENDVKDKEAVEAVIGKASVQNAAKALTDDAQKKLIADAGVNASELDESDTVTIVVNVAIKAVASDLSASNATLTFEATPTATVYVNGKQHGEAQDVTNDMLNGSITVKLPLPANFEPVQIAHKSDDYRTEYYLNHYERGAKQFEIKDVDGVKCAVFDITHFSTFVLSGTQTYVAPSRPSSSSSCSSISVGKTENGTIIVSPKTASKGETVTITVKPADGYELDRLTATDADGDTIRLTEQRDGTYTFTMPAGKVEVNGTFVKKSAQAFVDVPENAYYAPAIAWAVEKGVTEGTSATTFSPDAACTRAQIVTFLYRAAGSPTVKSTVNPFTDVTASDYYYNAVLWAVENGITTGTSATTFSPNESCTRAQCVTFLYRAVGSAAAAKASFTDVSADAYYAPAVDWAVENGVTTGTSATTFSPDDACTRAQIVTFLYRAYQGK